MASYAVPGGSVGPHFDQYDVFLIQISGHRRWQIGAKCDDQTPLLQGTELQIIDNFEATDEWLLGPGDCFTCLRGLRTGVLPKTLA